MQVPALTELPLDLRPVLTGDGSRTLESSSLGERYHSVFGAVTESRHVYMEQGLLSLGNQHVDILEVGLGTGLNALLTWVEADRHMIDVNYLALEPFPPERDLCMSMGHPEAIGEPGRREGFERLISTTKGAELRLSSHFRFHGQSLKVQLLEAEEAFDLVYFDAFAPTVQPEMWTLDVFQRLYRAMRPGAVLVTYCSKGDVRRAMMAAGLEAKQVKGPPGKYSMLRATRTA